MTPRRFPVAPVIDESVSIDCEYRIRIPRTPWLLEDVTRCKHGAGDCETCGTTDRRDAVHTTRDGVGALRRKKR